MSRQRKLLYQPILEKLACADINQTPASLRKTESRGPTPCTGLPLIGLVRFDHVANDQHIAAAVATMLLNLDLIFCLGSAPR